MGVARRSQKHLGVSEFAQGVTGISSRALQGVSETIKKLLRGSRGLPEDSNCVLRSRKGVSGGKRLLQGRFKGYHEVSKTCFREFWYQKITGVFQEGPNRFQKRFKGVPWGFRLYNEVSGVFEEVSKSKGRSQGRFQGVPGCTSGYEEVFSGVLRRSQGIPGNFQRVSEAL